MHLPDGFLDARTALLSTGVAAVGLGFALRQTRQVLEPRKVPLLGLAAAFVFVAQMLNFPIPGGTSGHLMGGVLTAILLGPSPAVLVITCVLIVQCLMFADGGLTALGANIFNMGIVSVWGGYFVFRSCRSFLAGRERSTVFAAAFAAWCGTVLASITCAGQLALSGAAPWALTFPAMANVHMFIGIGEGLATGLITLAILKARPDLVTERPRPLSSAPAAGVRYFLVFGALIASGLAVFVAPFASRLPDGLARVARQLGFEAHTVSSAIGAPASEYQMPFAGSATAATAVAGVVGLLIALAAAYGLARVLVPALSTAKKNAPPGH